MTFSYGDGEFIEGKKRVKGQIVLSEHKLYLRGPEGDLTETFIPLEKIQKVRQTPQGVEVHVALSLMVRFTALIRGEKKHINDLVKDLTTQRGLKKKFLKKEWMDDSK